MPRNEDGEFELVLGNKQLLSVFFIVVVLLGVFFTMGYIVGRNSAPLDLGRQTAEAKPIVIDSAVSPSTAEGGENAEAQAVNSQGVAPEGERQAAVEQQPATDTVQREQAPPPPTSVAPEAMLSGMYWQVAAVRRAEGELLVEMLSRKGFPARLVPAPTGDLLRVVVGPAADTAALATLKQDLEKLGYKQPIMRRY